MSFTFLILSLPTNVSASDVDLNFLTITAHQLAMSLENLELLKESQDAFAKLKKMQDETIQLEKMATKGEISAEIGHELNNFLGVVAGSISLMDFQLDKKNYNELTRYIQIMSENIEKMKKFTDNLMDLKTISTKKEIINFEDLISDVITYLKPQKRFKDVDIIFTPANCPLPFDADSTHIQQLLYNLLNNAADAMKDENLKSLEISVNRNSDNNSFKVKIKDNGCGFPSDQLSKAFNEKFTTKAQGHGFGLLVCHRIIESHNGTLDVESSPGEGTTITINFPLIQATVEETVSV